MTILIDSGSSKTSWAALDAKKQLIREWQTAGMNPYQQSQESLQADMLAYIPFAPDTIRELYYYGAGADVQQQQRLSSCIKEVFPNLQVVDIQSDIVAVAHALCQQEQGIVGILGTGSNSAVYDGEKVTDNIGGFGFILGDEGGGAVLGRALVNQYLHRRLPEHLSKELEKQYQLNPSKVIHHVYQLAYPNRFLAGFAPFMHQFQEEYSIKAILHAQFQAFFEHKIRCYPNAAHLPIYLAGSVAYYFTATLQEVAQLFNLKIGRIAQRPMPDLIRYHQNR